MLMNIIFKPECKTEIIEPTYDLPIIGEPISKTGASANNSNAYGVIVGIIGDGSSRRVRVMTEGYIDYDKVKENYMEYTDEAINALTGITLCSGGKLPDNQLNITGAVVGQIAKIAAVDDNGKPTAWQAVDMPGGESGETWELINEITIPDGAEETNALVINKDLNGNPFELKKALLFVYMPKYTGGSTIPNYTFASLNGINSGGSAPALYTNFIGPSNTQNRSIWWRVSVANNGLPYHEELARNNASGSKRVIGGNGTTALRDEYIIDGTEPAKESISEIGTTANLIYAGCYFALYGVRK